MSDPSWDWQMHVNAIDESNMEACLEHAKKVGYSDPFGDEMDCEDRKCYATCPLIPRK